MTVEVAPNTPLAEALNEAIRPKLLEVGWGSGGADDGALAEYIVLMLVNGRTQDEIAAEISGELLGQSTDDPIARDFAKWLFQEVEIQNARIIGAQSAVIADTDGPAQPVGGGDDDHAMDVSVDVAELNAPTGPKSMRNGGVGGRGGREKRMIGHISKAMERSGDSVLHRIRGQTGNERINTHSRGPPTGPRTGQGRLPRNPNGRAASIQAGMNAMGHGMNGPPAGPAAMNNAGGWMMGGQQQPQLDVFAMLEQQNRLIQQMSQQMMTSGPAAGGFGQQRHGKSSFDRGHNRTNRRGQHHPAGSKSETPRNESTGDGEDVDMTVKRDPPNPDETTCKFNLRCTNKDCKFAHQSPAAPPGATIDVNDVCTFGAACKNRKCVARHPSPAARLAHQSEQDCKFFPNCQNPHCTFRHPDMPLCRNGAGCTTPNCKFTHVKTKCKYSPCLNPNCVFAHDEGQQGEFKDKVWTSESADGHVSERKFVDDEVETEVVLGEGDGHNMQQAGELMT